MYLIRTLVVVSLMLISADVTAQEVFNITAGHQINTDGRISEGEWSDAQSFILHGGGNVFVKSDPAYYYFLVHGLKEGWCHLYISCNDTVFIFHASAALGTAAYVRDSNGDWEPVRPFTWNLRDTSSGIEAERLRKEFLLKENWLANTNRRGEHNVLEYKLSRQRFPPGKFLAAVVYADNEGPIYYWPEKLSDSTLLKELIWGTTPEKLKFDFSKWAEFMVD